MQSTKQIILVQLFIIFLVTAFFVSTALAKSVYVISDTETSHLQAYKIEDSNLIHQTNYLCQSDPSGEIGAVGLAIDKSDYGQFIFVTFELQNEIELVNAKTMKYVDTVTAAGASNLAGIAFDQGSEKLYENGRYFV